MKPHPKAIGAALALAALCIFGAPAHAADPSPTPDAALAPTPTPVPLHKVGGSDDIGIIVDSGDGTHPHHHHSKGDDRVAVLGSVEVHSDEEVNGSAVAVLGSLAVNGVVDEDAVSVLGSNTINGTVHGNAVSVLGNLHLGPNARVDGDVVCVGGHYTRDASASVGGTEVEKGASGFSDNPDVHAWLHHSLGMGRPFSIGEHSFGIWLVGLLMFALCILLALAFPAGVTKCGETLSHRPGITFLSGILTIIALPLLFVLLLITLVGIPVAVLVLPLCLAACVIFGKAAVYALIGRSIVGKQQPVVIAAMAGGIIFTLFYFVPFLGGALWILTSFIGFSCVLATLYTSAASRAPVVPVAPMAPAVALAPPVAADAAPAETAQPPFTAAVPLVPPSLSMVAESGLPRAGFWVRMVALLIDAILVGVATQMHSLFLPALAIYGAVLWKLKGSTVGGIIFGLKVVRVDGRPMDWVTAAVRALACFFSLIVVGLGFFWIGFDREKQGWHDKIAGTVVVRMPKGISLV
jgi:uncharacterized RDD family membrane protein YckC